MKMRNFLIFLALLLLLPFSLQLRGQDFGKGQSLFSDIKAHRIGDIVTILISEQNRATSQVESKNEKSSDMSMSGGPGLGPLLEKIPLFGLSGKAENKFDGKGENLRQGSIRARISCTVTDVRPNGDLVIEGTRVIGISKDRETITVSGKVRSRDVSPDNTVASHLIADAEISYAGKGASTTSARPGFFSRLFGWLF
ncbi:MAG: flagellar basal body L-ring protein FlgH [candidate division Zixibacteria bacterium]